MESHKIRMTKTSFLLGYAFIIDTFFSIAFQLSPLVEQVVIILIL
jgi:hypothetical protein